MRHSTLLTEFTDISQRLEYLVAHSSQLVFITGEDAAVQQGFVEAFLGQQSNNANVAFLNARRGKSNQYYRQQLVEQLDLHSSRSQSFVQAFAARDDKSQPVIIAITTAENIPEEVLRELWDLVLQNRFARNGEQVNILMFGDHEWAEEVKSWLPTNNNDKPVLLTTQTLEYDEETEVEGDLDEMIANRRKLFQQRMQARAKSEFAEQSLLGTWWFKLAVAAVFLVSFSSILIWQYFDVSKSALTEFTQFLFQENNSAENAAVENDSTERQDLTLDPQIIEEGAGQQSANDSNQRVAANFSAAMESLDNIQSRSTDEGESIKGTQEASVNSFSQRSADSPNSEYIADISAEQLKQLRDSGSFTASTDPNETTTVPSNLQPTPVTGVSETDDVDIALQASILDALNELDAIVYQSSSEAFVETSAPVQSVVSQPALESTDFQTNSVSDPDAVLREELAANEAITVNDFAVEDSVIEEPEIETSTIQTGVIENTSSARGLAPHDTSFSQEVSETTESAVALINEPGYRYHEAVLLELSNDSYVLQISGITTESLLEEFLVDNRLLNSVWVYKTQRYGGDWFVVLLNQSFDSLPLARNAVSLLSNDLQVVEPFAKSVAQIRNEILQ